MGSCVSLHNKGDSALKVRLDFGSKTTDKLKNDPPPPPKMVAPAPTDGAFKSHWSPATAAAAPDFGSKEETFFDSQAWLESDCEDDFYSVNGDFTPSRGNTPVHSSFSVRTTPGRNNGQLFTTSRTSAATTMPEPSPTEKKKPRLSELFRDSVGDDDDQQDEKNQEKASDKQHQKAGLISGALKSGNSTPNNEVGHLNSVSSQGTASTPATTKTLSHYVESAEGTPNGNLKPAAERSGKSSAQCCIPRLRSFGEKKKRSPSPVNN